MNNRRFFSAEKAVSVDSICTLFKAEHGPEFYFDGESHDFWELVYVTGGKVGITADDRIYDFSPGDIILHKPMEFHKIRSLDNTNISAYICSFKASGTNIQELENKTMRLMSEQRNKIDEVMHTAKEAFEFDGPYPAKIKNSKAAQRFFSGLELFLIELTESGGKSAKENENSKVFGKIISVLNEHIKENITVGLVAEECFISTGKLKKLFKRYTGMGVMAYFTELKIKKAMELLSGGLSVKETAEELSYSSQFYLSSVFKKVTGITPSKYKEKL